MSIGEISIALGVSRARLDSMFTDFENENTVINESTKHGSNSQRLEAKKLRETIFGCECDICGVDQNQRMLAVHRKDGTPHNTELVWNPRELRNLIPEEWALLCPNCHRTVHWSMNYLSMKWKNFELLSLSVSENQKKGNIPGNLSRESIRETRFVMFGEECRICGRHNEEHKFVLHRKDGEYHHRNSTWTTEFLRIAVIDEWIMLCNRCHISIHWYMDQFGIGWNEIEQRLSPRG